MRKLSGFNAKLQKVDQRYAWINEMIASRQELMVLYMKLFNDEGANAAENVFPSYDDVVSFCDHLIDYVSHGHFDLYPKILELVENASGRSLSIARRAMPLIEQTSDYLMAFNDRYCQDLDESKMKTLKKDLGEVSKCLETRFRNEDRLIVGLRLVHAAVETPAL